MKAIKVLIATTLLNTAAVATADSRQELGHLDLPWVSEQAQSVAVVLDQAAFYSSGNATVGVYSRSLESMYGLCSDQNFAGAPAIHGACSAFLINKNQVITSPSCVKGPAACESKKFVFGFASDQDDLTSLPLEKVFSCKSIDGSVVNNVGGAYTVVTLDRPVTQIKPLAIDSSPVAVGDEVYMLSHSHGLSARFSASKVWESTPSWNRFRAGIAAMRGSEGAPILSTNSGKVVGVHTSNLNSRVKYNPFRGCNETAVCEGSECFLEILGTANLFSKYSPSSVTPD